MLNKSFRFRELYRLPRSLAMDFLHELEDVMDENLAPEIPLTIQLCSTLNFFASGSHQRRIGQDAFAMLSQSCVSRCVNSISKTIATKLMDKHIVFPQTIEEIETLCAEFQEIADFPLVFALVDGTQIPVAAMKKEIEFAFVCRKGFHSINAQVMIDSKMRFLNVNARYPGSTHDSMIWHCSLVSAFLEDMCNQMGTEWKHIVLGDTGYPLEPWLLKTYDSPRSSAEKEFNVRHRSLRSLIERAIGLLKARFRCLLDGKLRYDPEKCGYIIYSCAVLHNFLLVNNYPVDDLVPVYDEPDDMDPPVINSKTYRERGAKLRNSLAQYFSQN